MTSSTPPTAHNAHTAGKQRRLHRCALVLLAGALTFAGTTSVGAGANPPPSDGGDPDLPTLALERYAEAMQERPDPPSDFGVLALAEYARRVDAGADPVALMTRP